MKLFAYAVVATFAPAVCYGAQSVVLQNGSQFQSALTRAGALSSIGDFRCEFRVHDFSTPVDSYGWIATIGDLDRGGFGVRFLQGVNILDFSDNADSYTSVRTDLAGRSDVLVRVQRDSAASHLTLEVWNADGTHYSATAVSLSSVTSVDWSGTPLRFGSATANTNLAYFRMYSAILPLGSPPPSATKGNIGDWEFEGNLVDKSGNGANLSGAASYVLTPDGPIHVSFGEYGSQRVWNAATQFLSLDGSSTYSSLDDAQYMYSWSIVNGPGDGHFSAPNQVVTTFTASAPGDYLIRLTASDGQTSGTLDMDFGAVSADVRNIVQTGDSAIDTALGPLTMWGTSPWPWYDYAEMANADALYSLVTAAPVYGQSALRGTVTATTGTQAVVGNGTHFIADLIDCNPSGASGSAYACTVAGISSLNDLNQRDRFFRPDVPCSGPAITININSYGPVPLVNQNCAAGSVYQLYYNSAANQFSINSNQPLVWLWWNGPDGPGSGRILGTAVVIDDTHLTLQANWLVPSNRSAGIQFSHPDSGELGVYWNYVSQPSNNLNYYDVVHALYKLYYRTGLTKYQTEARTFADNWFKYATGQGYAISAPRAIGYLGMIDRALDGHTSIWSALNTYLNYPWAVSETFQLKSPQQPGYSFDTREMGYATRFVLRAAALAQTDRGHPDNRQRALYCTWLHNIVANLYSPALDSTGQWESDLYSENISYPAAKYAGRFGSSPWRDAMTGLALAESYDVLSNSCGDSDTAQLALRTVTAFASNLHDYDQGRIDGASGLGFIPNIQYGSNSYTNIHGYAIQTPGSYVFPLTTGTLNVTAQSAKVTGKGTNFTAIFSRVYEGAAPADGIDSSFIGIPAAYLGSCNEVLEVLSVESDTELTLATPWPCRSASGVNGNGFGWVSAPAANRNCGAEGSQAATCEGAPDASLSHEVHAIWSWLFAKTNNTIYRDWALQSLGSDYGGPAGGPGSLTAAAGPYATGSTGNFASALDSCSAPTFAPVPCGGAGSLAALGKSFGFSAGAGNANNALAYLAIGSGQ